jgi:hypothetical protein
LNWKETPVKSPSLDGDTSGDVWGTVTNTLSDFMSQHRRRQRIFTGFFEFFTTCAVNIVDLTMPFDWSPRSLHALSQLKRLENLSLQTYFVPQPVDQSSVDQLLTSVNKLRRLTVAVYVSSGSGLVTYAIRSSTLEHLDVSECHGFYFSRIDLPKLVSLSTALRPYHGPLAGVVSDNVRSSCCMYELLRVGSPQLRSLNGQELSVDWMRNYYTELDDILKHICACRSHFNTTQ